MEDAEGVLASALQAIAHRGEPKGFARVKHWPSAAVALGSNRLPIVGTSSGGQPMSSPVGRYHIVFNGEVFNFRDVLARLGDDGGPLPKAPDSDTAVLAAAIERWGPADAVRELAWEGAFLCVDDLTGELWAGRDHLGIKPLYWARTDHGYLWASEIKALVSHAVSPIEPLPPGTLARMPLRDTRPPEVSTWWRAADHCAVDVDAPVTADRAKKLSDRLLQLMTEAVQERVPEEPYAVTLSGGVDSSLILRLAHSAQSQVTAYLLHTDGSPDAPYARSLCERLGIPLVTVQATPPEVLCDSLPDVVHAVESWEWQVVNHAAPMLALHRAIKANGHRVVLTGEGADELFLGYTDPTGPAQNPAELADERLRRVLDLHRTNCRRLDRMSMRETLECRVPFLDRRVAEFALGLPPSLAVRDGINKWVLRQAASRVLPREVAFRKKISFARGVGYDYGAGARASVFGPLPEDVHETIPAEWRAAARYPAERVFLRHFLANGYGNATYLRRGSR
ncbi:asparagine synthetase B family protein [Streptomyces tendae]|uniref:asparagine synthetase B family protein n=1 Tax=Streptomyces tendae TaxID=1932 RepID=UPI00365D88DA